MVNNYTRKSSTRLIIAVMLFSGLTSDPVVLAQSTLVPSMVTATQPPFTDLAVVENITLGITSATSASTTFPFSPTSSFNPEIGYVSQYGTSTGSFTYTFSAPVAISGMLMWNAYFDFELDHSLRDVDLIFRDLYGQEITTQELSFAQATATDLTGESVSLPVMVENVSTVQVDVITLWGGNDISLRRMAFVGTGPVGIGESAQASFTNALHPNPAIDHVIVPLHGIRHVALHDALGREVPVDVKYHKDHAVVRWEGLAHGTYSVIAGSGLGTARSRILVGAE